MTSRAYEPYNFWYKARKRQQYEISKSPTYARTFFIPHSGTPKSMRCMASGLAYVKERHPEIGAAILLKEFAHTRYSPRFSGLFCA